MSDLISRQVAIDAVRVMQTYKLSEGGDMLLVDQAEVMTELMMLPSAEPEIIRCKDCKHRYIKDMTWHCPFGLIGGENFFCGYGSLGIVERRTEV